MSRNRNVKELTTPAAARYLQIAEGTVRRLADCGRLEHRRNALGARVFKVESLDSYRAARETANAS